MIKQLKRWVIDQFQLGYCGCSAGAAGGDAACGDAGGGSGSTDGPSPAQAAAANQPGGFAVTATGFATNNNVSFSNNADGSVSVTSGETGVTTSFSA